MSGGNAAAGDGFAGLLFLARAFPQRLIAQREHRWLQLRRDKAPADVEGQTVLIAGGGAAAAEVARFVQALASSSTVKSGVAPNSVMLARIGTFTASANFLYIDNSVIASGKIMSAPASTQAPT